MNEIKMATDEQFNALVAAGIDEADAGSYSATEARRKLVELARPEPTPCRCGCEGLSRGLFVPGHDARHKGALARRMFEALSGDTADADVAAAVRVEADAIDVAYGREPGKWIGLINKQVENLRKQLQAEKTREAKGTPVQRARRAHVKAARDGGDDTKEGSALTAQEEKDAYIDDLIEDLRRYPKTGQLGWLRLPDQERQVARVQQTFRNQNNYATMIVKLVDTSEILTVQCEQWLYDPDLHRGSRF